MSVTSHRRIAWSSLVGCILAQGLAGVWHPHVHPPSGDGHCATECGGRPVHACGHRHGDEKTTSESKRQHAPCQPGESHDEHDCCVCRFLAIPWLGTPHVQHSPHSDLVAPCELHWPRNPYSAPHYAHPSRGPPAV